VAAVAGGAVVVIVAAPLAVAIAKAVGTNGLIVGTMETSAQITALGGLTAGVVTGAATGGAAPSPAAPSVVAGTRLCRTFTSNDRHVGELATKIEAAYPGHVVGVNVNKYRADGSVAAEADILLRNGVIQVKGGTGTGMARQLSRTEREFGLPALGYGPDLGRHVMRNTASTNNESLIIEVVKP
jgi:hypothetical protein